MPQERHNPFPMPTAEEVAEWQTNTDAATAAARNIIVRNIHGLYRRPYLRGDSDHAPILKGIRDLAEVAIEALELLASDHPQHTDLIARLQNVLTDHGCPTYAEASAAEATLIENLAKEA